MSGSNSKITVGILDLKIHNLFSIYHFMKDLRFNVKIVDRNEKIRNFDIFLIPGVGSFDKAMQIMKRYDLDKKIKEYENEKNFIFAICLGMQLLFDESNEFKKTKGLGIIEGSVNHFPNKKFFIVPHVGWNKIKFKKNFLYKEGVNEKDFYFIHSLLCKPKVKENILTTTTYNKIEFCSSILSKNVLATQFHPEKSGISGIKFVNSLKRFI